ncbi:restriction endonuclease [Spirillospora sp. NPDC047279]|uniref:nSTAND1 domain-containing NTPase n=1 Tax=Spirillospora sp. NPDC047279 TaxID=3155478 RepID=UPI0033D1CC4D
MQIAFFDSGHDELTSQRKGSFFEAFTKRLVELSGYKDVQLRSKRSSLEYDIEATSKLHDRPLLGEAKAHEASMSGKEASAFVGKLLPVALQGKGLDGLFISTSPFTPEGEDYLRSVRGGALAQTGINLRTLVGDEIVKFLEINNICISEDRLRNAARATTGLEPCDTWLVVGQRGDFLLATCGNSVASPPTHFATFSLAGEVLNLLPDEVKRLASQVADLQGLTYSTKIAGSEYGTSERHTLPPIVAGAGWFDYKFPSPPECFIGRNRALVEIGRFIEQVQNESTALRAVQILSRSGVGKSSLLLKLADTEAAEIAVTVDGRNLRTPSDLRLMAVELVNKARQADLSSLSEVIGFPRTQEEVPETFHIVGEALRKEGKVALLQVDQFEALLSRPAVFQSLLDLVLSCTTWAAPLVWVMARKNDLAATYDEGAAIDLAQLNQVSQPIRLDDFTPSEEQVLLDRLTEELGGKLSRELSEAILTFSSGFPWLLKRICAHVISMSKDGASQAELSRGGLRAEDLFNEDLAGLEEADKALLRTFAAHMPNTASELARRLEGEVGLDRLTHKLNDFLGHKLLRLSGDVYDTYNDVFKAYLLTERVPFQTRYVFRVTPGPSLDLLLKIAEDGPMEIGPFMRHIGGNSTATSNKLRELRLLGMLDPQAGKVSLSADAATALDSDTMGDYLRRALRSNALVGRVMDLVAQHGSVSLSEVERLLRSELPHIRASDNTWSTYASTLANWIRYAGMVDIEGDLIRQRESFSDDLVLRREFNLGNFTPGAFIPSVRPNKVRQLVERLQQQPTGRNDLRSFLSRNIVAATLRDAKSLGLVDDTGEFISLAPQGRAMAARADSVSDRDIAMLALAKPNIAALLQAVESAGLVTPEEQREILARFGNANWAEGTWKWRIGIINSWVTASGQAKSSRGGLKPCP